MSLLFSTGHVKNDAENRHVAFSRGTDAPRVEPSFVIGIIRNAGVHGMYVDDTHTQQFTTIERTRWSSKVNEHESHIQAYRFRQK
mmetsp:Transcript_23468/g.34637  ORF Transcript_23468/g.34637 Transcript_23468/m.34637 type:complete len:85 (+) Transcript_23468:909-1163(+)